ncbi:MAG: DUF4062 domain-containing protein [Methanocorpusculum sp.]|nr:DUF4062 domain-containing protein [Oscillospiraceae bacterium]MBQ3569724.1 DUF4062 domain-containing protein [Methanocorpusculum sp.]
MLDIFLSSTFKDLDYVRSKILTRLQQSVTPRAMEYFASSTSPQKFIFHDGDYGIINADYIIYLLTPQYGSLIDECHVSDSCSELCLNEREKKEGNENIKFAERCYYHEGTDDCNGKISYTHCELRLGRCINCPHLIFLFGNLWKIYDILNNNKLDCCTKWKYGYTYDKLSIQEREDIVAEVGKNSNSIVFDENEISLTFNNMPKLSQLMVEIGNETLGRCNQDNVDRIFKSLVKDILDRYAHPDTNPNFKFKNFVGNHSELKKLYKIIDTEKSLLLWGPGGIGKTTLAEVLTLLRILETGDKAIIFSRYSAYISKSGYRNDKIRHIRMGQSEKLTLDHILNTLSSDNNIMGTDADRMDQIANICNKNNILLLIDDIDLADKSVYRLLNKDITIIATSKKNNLVNSQAYSKEVTSIEEVEELLLYFARILGINPTLVQDNIDIIQQIAGGYPIFSYLMVRNLPSLLDKQTYKNMICELEHNSKEIYAKDGSQEIWKRIIKLILTEDEIRFLRLLSLFDYDIFFNINQEVLRRACSNITIYGNVDELLSSLSEKGFVERNKDGKSWCVSYHQIVDYINGLKFDDDEVKTNYNICLDYYGILSTEREGEMKRIANIEILYYEILLGLNTSINVEKVITYSDEYTNRRELLRIIDCCNTLLRFKTLSMRNTIDLLYHCGNLHLELNDFHQANKKFEKAKKLLKSLVSENELESDIYFASIQEKRGRIFELIGEGDKALRLYKNALVILNKNPYNNRINIIKNLINCGRLYWMGEDYVHSKDNYDKAKVLLNFDEISYFITHTSKINCMDEELNLYSMLCNNYGLLYQSVIDQNSQPNIDCKLDDVQSSYELALNAKKILLSRDKNNYDYQESLANTYYNLARLSKLRGEYDNAEKMYLCALNIRNNFKEIGLTSHYMKLADTFVNLANLYDDYNDIFQKDYSIIENLYSESLNLRRDLEKCYPKGYDAYNLTYTLINMGDFYFRRFMLEKAKEFYSEAICMFDNQTEFNNSSCYHKTYLDKHISECRERLSQITN